MAKAPEGIKVFRQSFGFHWRVEAEIALIVGRIYVIKNRLFVTDDKFPVTGFNFRCQFSNFHMALQAVTGFD